MNIIKIIDKKRNKLELTKEEISFFLNEYQNNNVFDYQMSAFLMAVVINGLSDSETIYLTDEYIKSGTVLKLENDSLYIDKHSTGGVGDKITPIIIPILASLGYKSIKMSGRGLGITGGTADKLESIKGIKLELTEKEVFENIRKTGAVLITQTTDIAPLDKLIYALRDVTATTDSIPLIAASIMSKKIASGAGLIIIDLKVGSGALVKTFEDAKSLAHLMILIGKNYKKKVICILTNMDQPLGNSVGNGLEIREVLDYLNGKRIKDIDEINSAILEELGIKENLVDIINSKKPLNLFEEIIKNQNGDLNNIDISKRVQAIKSTKSGYIKEIKADVLGELLKKLGGGRMHKEDSIDHSVGFVLSKKIGDKVEINEDLLYVYYNKKDIQINEIQNAFVISKEFVKANSTIIEIIK